MATKKQTTAIGVFESREKAQQAVQELKRMGFNDNQIGVVSHNAETGKAEHTTGSGSHVEEGAVAGVAAGAGVGALWGIGIAAGLLPAIGPVIAGGTLAAVLASAATGAAAAGLAGALIGMGIPEDEAGYYEGEFKSGRTLVTVKADTRYDEAVAVLRRFGAYDRSTGRTTSEATRSTAGTSAAHLSSHSGAAHTTAAAAHATSNAASHATSARAGDTVQLREEQLHVSKTPVETGEVKIRKEVHTETKTIDVPVTKEEVVIERNPVHGQATSAGAGDIQAGQEIRIPVREEQVNVEKTAVVKEEVKVGKRKVTETEHVTGEVRKEDVRVETRGDVDVNDRNRRS